jgi:predicted aspartyl protease
LLFVRGDDGKYEPWTTGQAVALLAHEGGRHRLPVGVSCRIADLSLVVLLDTGADWSVVDAETAEAAGSALSEPLDDITIHTRYGTLPATLHRLTMTLLANEGADLAVDATVAVIQNWPGPVVLGVRGCLERLRIALDPGGPDATAAIHFGTF